jgi:Hemerythrin HHE cation binding domain
MNIFQCLRKDHDHQRQLMQDLLETKGDTEERRDLFDEVKVELHAHAIAEERHFYVPLIQTDLMQEKSRHAISEHHEIDELIEALEEIEFSSSAWLMKARELGEKVHHHLDEEEHEFFQLAGKALDEKSKLSLAKDFIEEKERCLADKALCS